MFHGAEEMRRLQGVGSLLKEQKVVDRRPAAQPVAGAGGSSLPAAA
jgi:hypothetical protein